MADDRRLTTDDCSPMPRSQADVSDLFPGVQQEVAHLCSLTEIRSAFTWFRAQEPQFAQWQLELARIAAPPFGESARGKWLADKFCELGLESVHTDEVGNVFGTHPGYGHGHVSLSAHLDTVFPAGTPLNIQQQGSRLYGPGVSDNGAGVTAMLAMVAALRALSIRHALPLLFIGNVGEEGEGDLRGMRHIFSQPRWKDQIHYSLVLDGAGADTIVAEALGSRRFEVIVRGPGGHSWSDFGAPNPIVVLSRAVQAFAQTTVPASPKTTFNVGVIRGGTSVNSIPESASMRVDIRSTSMAEMERLERALRHAIGQAVEQETRATEMRYGVAATALWTELRSGSHRKSSRGRTVSECPHPAGGSRRGRATGQCGASATRFHRCQHPAVARTRGHCHRRRRDRRRGAHLAGMV